MTCSQFKDIFRRIINLIQTLGNKYPSKNPEITRNILEGKVDELQESKTKHLLENCLKKVSYKVKILWSTLVMIPIKNNKYRQKAKKRSSRKSRFARKNGRNNQRFESRPLQKLSQFFKETLELKETSNLPDVKSIAKSVKGNIEDIWEETCLEK